MCRPIFKTCSPHRKPKKGCATLISTDSIVSVTITDAFLFSIKQKRHRKSKLAKDESLSSWIIECLIRNKWWINTVSTRKIELRNEFDYFNGSIRENCHWVAGERIVKCEANARNVEKRFFSRNLCRQSRKQFSSLEIFIRSTRILSDPHCICPDSETFPENRSLLLFSLVFKTFFHLSKKLCIKFFNFLILFIAFLMRKVFII